MRQKLEVRQVYCYWTCDEMSRCVWTDCDFIQVDCVIVCVTALASRFCDAVVS
jgi:hypothetical protein